MENRRESSTDWVYLFKVRDYTTMLVGRRYWNNECKDWVYYVQRGDGTCYTYENYRVTSSELILRTSEEEYKG